MPKPLITSLHDTLLQRYFYVEGRLTTDGVLLTGTSKGSDIAVFNKGNHLLEAFGYACASFTMKPSNTSFDPPPHGEGWYFARSSYGFCGHYKEAKDQAGDWRARQTASVAGLVAARKAAAGGGGGGGGGGGP